VSSTMLLQLLIHITETGPGTPCNLQTIILAPTSVNHTLPSL
jgi:hypothetical protein